MYLQLQKNHYLSRKTYEVERIPWIPDPSLLWELSHIIPDY